MNYTDFSTFFYEICENQQNIVQLTGRDLFEFKRSFFKLDFADWKLNLLWEFIWGDKPYNEVFNIFCNKKLLKK